VSVEGPRPDSPFLGQPRTLGLIALPIALWIIDLVRIVWPLPALATAGYLVVAVYLALGLKLASRSNLVLSGAMLAAAAAIHQGEMPFAVVARGLEFAVIFGAFLAVIQLVRATVESLPGAETSRGLFADMNDAERRSAITVSCHLLSVVLSIGAFAIIRPLLPPAEGSEERRRQALACLRGVCLALYWSPFTVGIAYIFFTFPHLPPWQVFGVGWVFAVAAISLSLLVDGRSGGWRALPRIVPAFRPILLPLGVATLAVVAMVGLTGLSNLQATIVVMPLFCAFFMSVGGRDRAWRVARMTLERMGRTGDDMLVFTAAVVLGSILLDARDILQAVGGLMPANVPVLVQIVGLSCVGLALGLAGLNAILVGTVVVALASGLPGGLPDLVLALIVLYGWTCASMLSFASMAVVISSRMFQVGVRGLGWGRNASFLGLFGLLSSAVLYAATRFFA
jgi:hypothetical protein